MPDAKEPHQHSQTFVICARQYQQHITGIITLFVDFETILCLAVFLLERPNEKVSASTTKVLRMLCGSLGVWHDFP